MLRGERQVRELQRSLLQREVVQRVTRGDDELFRLYDWRVPLVLVDDVVVAEGKIEKETLKRLLLG